MGVYEARGQLDKALKELLARWQEARAAWDDPMSDKFEKDHLEPWAADLKRAAAAMGHVAQVVTAARHECE